MDKEKEHKKSQQQNKKAVLEGQTTPDEGHTYYVLTHTCPRLKWLFYLL